MMQTRPEILKLTAAITDRVTRQHQKVLYQPYHLIREHNKCQHQKSIEEKK